MWVCFPWWVTSPPASIAATAVQPVVEDRRPLEVVRLVTEGGEVGVRRRAEADTEHGPPAAQMVERRHVLGDHLRPAAGERGDERSEAHALRGVGDGAEQHPRIMDRSGRHRP